MTPFLFCRVYSAAEISVLQQGAALYYKVQSVTLRWYKLGYSEVTVCSFSKKQNKHNHKKW